MKNNCTRGCKKKKITDSEVWLTRGEQKADRSVADPIVKAASLKVGLGSKFTGMVETLC